ncbi:hypothetical protein HJ052_19310 [Vibrio parahaemolyticus]|nr:hypothetical protein [Vibrio parahaemolyticus]HCG7052258.1 hypothetical protein [Vibrio parahaemolyticus]HCH0358250.1 hypothetical protein [Vibrio parahaemolyticus]
MRFDSDAFSRLLEESKNAIAPLMMERREFASLLERQKITVELIQELEELAESQGVIMAQVKQDFLFVANWYECDIDRVYRERFSDQEIDENSELAEAKLVKLWADLELDPDGDFKSDEPEDALDIYLDAVKEVIHKSPFGQSSTPESLKEFISITEAIVSEYASFLSSDELDSDDLESALDEFGDLYGGDPDEFPEVFLPGLVNTCCDTPLINEFYLCFKVLFVKLTSTVAQVHELYAHLSDIRKAVYADSH